jgi:hypothetical protein
MNPGILSLMPFADAIPEGKSGKDFKGAGFPFFNRKKRKKKIFVALPLTDVGVRITLSVPPDKRAGTGSL